MKYVTINATKTILGSIIKRHWVILNILVALIAANHCITLCTQQLIQHVDSQYIMEKSDLDFPQVQLNDIKASVHNLISSHSKTVPFVYLVSILIKFLIQILAMTIAVQVALCSIHGRKYMRFTPQEFVKSFIIYSFASLTALIPFPFLLPNVSPLLKTVGIIAYTVLSFMIWRATVAAVSLVLDQKKSILESLRESFSLTSKHYFNNIGVFILFMIIVMVPSTIFLTTGMTQGNIYLINFSKLYLLPLASIYTALLNVSFYAQLSNQHIHA